VIFIKFDKYIRIYAQGLDATITEYGVTQGIMMFVVAAIMIAILIPVLNGVMVATPIYTTNPLAVRNMTSGGLYIAQGIPIVAGEVNTTGAGYGILTTVASIATAQQTTWSTVASGYGLMVVVLIIVAAAVILGALALFRTSE